MVTKENYREFGDDTYWKNVILDTFQRKQYQKYQEKLEEYFLSHDKRDVDVVLWVLYDAFHSESEKLPEKVFLSAAKELFKTLDKRIPVMNERDRKNLDVANQIISGKDYYYLGDTEEVKGKGVVVFWNNSWRGWYIDNWKTEQIKSGKQVSLDANEMFLPMSERCFERIQHRLDMLPLFFGSFQAKTGSFVSWDTADNIFDFSVFKGKMERERKKQKKWREDF